MQPVDVELDVRVFDGDLLRRVDVEAKTVAQCGHALDRARHHVDEVDPRRERCRLAVADGHAGVAADAHADAVELGQRPGLRAHTRTGKRVPAEVDGDAIRCDDHAVAGAGHVVREGEAFADAHRARSLAGRVALGRRGGAARRGTRGGRTRTAR